jgi:hypothetical protein
MHVHRQVGWNVRRLTQGPENVRRLKGIFSPLCRGTIEIYVDLEGQCITEINRSSKRRLYVRNQIGSSGKKLHNYKTVRNLS